MYKDSFEIKNLAENITSQRQFSKGLMRHYVKNIDHDDIRREMLKQYRGPLTETIVSTLTPPEQQEYAKRDFPSHVGSLMGDIFQKPQYVIENIETYLQNVDFCNVDYVNIFRSIELLFTMYDKPFNLMELDIYDEIKYTVLQNNSDSVKFLEYLITSAPHVSAGRHIEYGYREICDMIVEIIEDDSTFELSPRTYREVGEYLNTQSRDEDILTLIAHAINQNASECFQYLLRKYAHVFKTKETFEYLYLV